MLETGQCQPYSEGSTAVLCCQLPTDFITSVLSKVFERRVSVSLARLWKAVVCFQPLSLLIEKVWELVICFCACPIDCKVHWRMGRRLGSCRLISAQPLIGSTIREFDNLSFIGIIGSVLSTLTQFLSNQSQHVMEDSCRNKLVNVLSRVLQGSVYCSFYTSLSFPLAVTS